jgi:hypothetical protein
VAWGATGPLLAAARAIAPHFLAGAALHSGGFRFADLTDFRDAKFMPGAVKYLDLPGLLALGTPSPLWLSGEPVLPELLARFAPAYQGALTVHPGPPDPSAALKWLMDQTVTR